MRERLLLKVVRPQGRALRVVLVFQVPFPVLGLAATAA